MPVVTYRATVKNRNQTKVILTENFYHYLNELSDPTADIVLMLVMVEYRRQLYIRRTYDKRIAKILFRQDPVHIEVEFIDNESSELLTGHTYEKP